MAHASDSFDLSAGVQTDLGELKRHALLAHPIRGTLLRALEEETPPLSIDELADAVETEVDPTAAEVAITCHHVHLPKLAAFDVIAYDASTRTIIEFHADRIFS